MPGQCQLLPQCNYPFLLAPSVLDNASYHASEGVSNSVLSDFNLSPARVMWRQKAPIDETKTKALDMGSALHARLLEPHLFPAEYAVEPVLDRRTKAGKIAADEFTLQNQGKTILSAEDGRKLDLMVRSVFAHPTAAWLLGLPGISESSIFWQDKETGIKCRCRPDRIIDSRATNGQHIVVDVKKIADIARFPYHVEEFRYHVQAAMYQDGYRQIFGQFPLFVFLVVSESVDCGRYPVDTFVLDDDLAERGWDLYRNDLKAYSDCEKAGQWSGFRIVSSPYRR